MPEPLPQYQRLKAYITEAILAGELKPGQRIPSELDLVKRFEVSRMTATRALKELEQDGVISRMQGVGSFVSVKKTESALFEINNISDSVRRGGQAYFCQVISLGLGSDPAIQDMMGLPRHQPYARSGLLHHADGVPVQFEDRYANLAFAPDYLAQDFTKVTPYDHLMSLGPLQAAEQVFEAARPDAEMARLLRVKVSEPCILLRRRTWSLNLVASVALITAPSSRYRFGGTSGTPPDWAAVLPRL
ncbi:UTRA domain-containing protein [Oleomonas cavernae]|nr:UTRA domain-containing protein [Oleomonas cavernae]